MKVSAPKTWFDRLVIWCWMWAEYLPPKAREELADLARQGLRETED